MSSYQSCQLCGQHEAIKNSHIIPALIYRAVKTDSPTGFFRFLHSPNVRQQDGDKLPLLCGACEKRFNELGETPFANKLFLPFHTSDTDSFTYGPWLHYFLTSVAWRTLVVDLPELLADASIPEKLKSELASSASTMRSYLLGDFHLGRLIRQHAFIFVAAHSCTPELAMTGPNVMIRRSVGGYTLFDKRHGHAAVIHNLAGFICVLLIKQNPRDTWHGTLIDPIAGAITQPQRIRSWVMGDLLNLLMELRDTRHSLSSRQQRKIHDAVTANLQVPAMRFSDADRHLTESIGFSRSRIARER